MPLVLANRVQESGTANTTVSFTLTGAVTGFQSFSTIGNGNTTYYSATDAAGNWEVGLGLYLATGSILVRTAVYESSNAGSAVTFSGAVNVFVTLPSGSAIYEDASGNASPLGTVTSGTWQGSTVGVAYGGTGVTASSGPNSVVLRDANENITINRLNQGLQTTTASGGTTVLTAASDFNQALVGTGGHTYSLPDATTLSDTTAFQFNNNATGTLTITDYASATIGTVAPGGAAGVALLNNSTVGGTWDVHAYIPENVTWGTNALALGTTVVSGGTWQGGTIQSGYGGTGLTTFAGANNALYSTSASALAAGTLPVAAGGTGLTSYTLNGVVYASGTGTLATGSALTFDGTNLINTGAYTAPNNGAGAGTKTTIRGSTGTGQAGASGGNGFIELVGGGGTSTWTAFSTMLLQRRRGGIYLQAGTAQADAGGTYVNGSTINIVGSAGTNNGTATGVGSQVLIQSGATTKIDGQSNTGSSINLSISSSTVGSSTNITSGSFNTSAGGNGGGYITLVGATATTGGNVTLGPGLTNIAGSTVGKAYVRDPATNTDNEILTTNRIVAGANITVTNCAGFLTIAASGGGGSCATPTVAGIVYGKTSGLCFGATTALGYGAACTGGGGNAVAIGKYAGQTCQGNGTVAIGGCAGNVLQGTAAVAVGACSGKTSQSTFAVAVGLSAGNCGQGNSAVAIGYNAGPVNQGSNAIAIGRCSGAANQSANSISIGATSYVALNSNNAVAIGYGAQVGCCQISAIAFGPSTTSNGSSQTHIGPIRFACSTSGLDSLFYCGSSRELIRGAGGGGGGSPATPTVAGVLFGKTACCAFCSNTALGYNANGCNAVNNASVAIGTYAGLNSQGFQAVAIGAYAGNVQSCYAVAVGTAAGQCGQGFGGVAVGFYAGAGDACCSLPAQSCYAVAIGFEAGRNTQGTAAVAIGNNAGYCQQCSGAVAVGYQAGKFLQGTAAIAIGYGAGSCCQPSNSIVIAACGLGFNATGVCQFHVKPIRNASGPFTLKYNPCTGEITYN